VPFIPLIVAGIGAATTGIAAYEMTQQPSAPTAPTQAQTSTQQAQASQDAAQAQAEALTKQRGMAATMLTSPMGAGPAQTQKTTLGA
jgi:hypothetical protein